VNPDTPLPTPPTPPQQPQVQMSSSWKDRLKSLNQMHWLLILVAAVMAILVLTLAVSKLNRQEIAPTPSSTPAAALPAQVSITKAGFAPATISIKAGTQVTWTNSDDQPHQVAADPHPKNDSIPGLDSDTTLLAGDSFSFTFEKPDTYTYHDHLNPLNATWQGTVIVE